jgi:hypothetical protein
MWLQPIIGLDHWSYRSSLLRVHSSGSLQEETYSDINEISCNWGKTIITQVDNPASKRLIFRSKFEGVWKSQLWELITEVLASSTIEHVQLSLILACRGVARAGATSFPGSSLLLRKDPGWGWSPFCFHQWTLLVILWTPFVYAKTACYAMRYNLNIWYDTYSINISTQVFYFIVYYIMFYVQQYQQAHYKSYKNLYWYCNWPFIGVKQVL